MNTTAIFLDRDGVINTCIRGKWTDHEDDFELYPYTIKSMQLLQQIGAPIFIATNQSGVARKTLKHSEYYKITAKMLKSFEDHEIEITRVYECMHPKDGSTNCPCRKPKTWMITKAIKEYEIPPGKMWMVGDSASDVEMALMAGITPILVRTGLCDDIELAKSAKLVEDLKGEIYIEENLLAAAERIYSSS